MITQRHRPSSSALRAPGERRGERDLVTEAEHGADQRQAEAPTPPSGCASAAAPSRASATTRPGPSRSARRSASRRPRQAPRSDRRPASAGEIIRVAHSGHQIVVSAKAVPQQRQDADDPQVRGRPRRHGLLHVSSPSTPRILNAAGRIRRPIAVACQAASSASCSDDGDFLLQEITERLASVSIS